MMEFGVFTKQTTKLQTMTGCFLIPTKQYQFTEIWHANLYWFKGQPWDDLKQRFHIQMFNVWYIYLHFTTQNYPNVGN